MQYPVNKPDSEWRAQLTPQQFKILREKGTEMAGTGEYDKHYPDKGVYECAGCGTPLYTADMSTSPLRSSSQGDGLEASRDRSRPPRAVAPNPRIDVTLTHAEFKSGCGCSSFPPFARPGCPATIR